MIQTERVSLSVKEIAAPLSEELRDAKVQQPNEEDEDIIPLGSWSGSSQDVIVLLILMQLE